MTPYAILLCRPSDADLTIRQRFHALSKAQHPDRAGGGGVPGPLWFVITTAYGLVKSSKAREAYAASLRGLSRLCPVCDGYGVRGSRAAGGRLRACDGCRGEGRVREKA